MCQTCQRNQRTVKRLAFKHGLASEVFKVFYVEAQKHWQSHNVAAQSARKA